MPPKRQILRSSSLQIEKLVDYMSTNPLFSAGEFRGPLGYQQMAAEWDQVKAMLANYGPDKSVDQWKHTWRDLKKKARADGGRIRLSFNRTGNAETVPELSTTTTKILETIGTECATGIGVEQETGIGSGVVDTGASESSLEAGESQQEADHAEIVVVTPSRLTRPRLVRPPRPNPSPTARRRRRRRTHQQQHSAAFVDAQRKTNMILRDIANEIRGAARRERRNIIGPLHRLKF